VEFCGSASGLVREDSEQRTRGLREGIQQVVVDCTDGESVAIPAERPSGLSTDAAVNPGRSF
jgi:hypothetical protein